MKMKTKDTYFLAHLRADSRMPLTRLSRLTQTPVSTLFDRLKNHKGLIKKFTVLPDFAKLGFGTRVCAAIKVEKEDKEELEKFLEKHLNVNSLFKINNGFNFLIDGVFRDMGEVEEFKDHLESKFQIRGMDIFYILGEIKQESFLDSSMKVDALGSDNHVERAQ